MPSYEKAIGHVRVTIVDKTVGGMGSREIRFTRRLPDGSDVASFADEGDLAQLGMALWRTQEWLKDHQDDGCAESAAASTVTA